VVDLVVDPAAGMAVPAAWRRRLRVELVRMVRAAARAEGRDDLELALRLTDDRVIRELNRDYRKIDRPTDVLAFAQREAATARRAQPGLLGDVVISVETARRQAKRRGTAGLFAELRFLAAHGLCHLLGYDHRDDAEEAEMNARMAALIAEAGRRGAIRAA
jgi:probable rRNA maturation factor